MDFREASVSYGDLCGQVVIDGYMGPFVHELALLVGVPQTHFPIGFSLLGGEGVTIDEEFHLTIAAVRKTDYGASIEDILHLAKNGEVEADLFSGTILLPELLKHIKRINLTVVNSSLDKLQIVSRK